MAEKDFVKLKNVTKIYQMGEVQIRAVDGIDFSIDKGEFVVVVGPSRAGKNHGFKYPRRQRTRPPAEKSWWTERTLPVIPRSS